MKKFVSIVLSLIMLMSMMSVAAFAATEVQVQLPGSAETTPFSLDDAATVADLKAAIVEKLNEGIENEEDKYLAENIHFYVDGEEVADTKAVSDLEGKVIEMKEKTTEEEPYIDMLDQVSKGAISTSMIHDIIHIALLFIQMFMALFGSDVVIVSE